MSEPALPEPYVRGVNGGSGYQTPDLYTADQLRAALAAQAERHAAALRTLENLGYTNAGGLFWKPPIGKAPNFDLIDALRAEVEALRADALRYRHLKAHNVSENDDGEKCVYFWCDFEHYDDVDAAIDAAMGAARGDGQ